MNVLLFPGICRRCFCFKNHGSTSISIRYFIADLMVFWQWLLRNVEVVMENFNVDFYGLTTILSLKRIVFDLISFTCFLFCYLFFNFLFCFKKTWGNVLKTCYSYNHLQSFIERCEMKIFRNGWMGDARLHFVWIRNI